jgi:hypothetical protein
MWQAVVVSWLMVVSSGQLELNAPQNAIKQPETIVKQSETIVQPAWKPSADDSDEQPTVENAPPAAVRKLPIHDIQPVAKPFPPTPAPTPEPAPDPALPKAILTRQTYFSISARPDTSDKSTTQAVEVQLFFSRDQGANWSFYNRVKPDQPRIPFRANADGEYWFATRTLDKSGKFEPQNITTPTTIAVIDTKPPTVLLSAENANGQVTVRWEITDPHLKPDSLSLQYRSSQNSPWQPIAINGNDSTFTDSTLSGETSWWPAPGTKEIVVRAEVSDIMGNKAVGHAQLKLEPGGSNSNNLGRSASPHPKEDAAGMKPETAKTNPKIGTQYPTGSPANLLNNPYYAYLPPNEKPRMVNSRVFELDYDLQAVGPSGVSRVELFGTRDGGRTWRSFGIDGDNRSPMTVRVDEEGLYGFQIVVTSGAGLGDPPPKSGEKPSIWIGVDLTRPTAKITSAEFGSGENEGNLVIAWEAADKMPAEKPVTLYYSPQSGGPFTPLAQELKNTGQFVWSIDGTVPPIVYLRLEVRDEAGNRTFFDYPKAIALDRSRPTGKIRDVRPSAP